MKEHGASPPIRTVFVGPTDPRLLTSLRGRPDVDIVGHCHPEPALAGDVDAALIGDFVRLRAHLWVLGQGGAHAAFLRALRHTDPTGRHVALLGPGVRPSSDSLAELRTLERETNGKVKVVPWVTGRYRLGPAEFRLRTLLSPHRTRKITRLVAVRDAAADPVEELREPLDTWFSIALTGATSVKASITREPNAATRLVGVLKVPTDYLSDPEHAVHFEVRHISGTHSHEAGTAVTYRGPQTRPWTGPLGEVALMRRLANYWHGVTQYIDELTEDEAVETLLGHVVSATRHRVSMSGLDQPLPTLEQLLQVERTIDAVRTSIGTPGRLRFKTSVKVST